MASPLAAKPFLRPYTPELAKRPRTLTDSKGTILADQIRTEFLRHESLFADLRLLAIEAYYP
jgi:hypothetical protein